MSKLSISTKHWVNIFKPKTLSKHCCSVASVLLLLKLVTQISDHPKQLLTVISDFFLIFFPVFSHENWKKCLHHGGRNAVIVGVQTSASVWSVPRCFCVSCVRPSCLHPCLTWRRNIQMNARLVHSHSSRRSHRTSPTSPSVYCSYTDIISCMKIVFSPFSNGCPGLSLDFIAINISVCSKYQIYLFFIWKISSIYDTNII